jgi:hypothetical protein
MVVYTIVDTAPTLAPHHGSPSEGGALSYKKITQKIPDGTLVPAGAVVTSEEDVRALKEG